MGYIYIYTIFAIYNERNYILMFKHPNFLQSTISNKNFIASCHTQANQTSLLLCTHTDNKPQASSTKHVLESLVYFWESLFISENV